MDGVGNDMRKDGYYTIRIYWSERDVGQWALKAVAFESLCARHQASIMYVSYYNEFDDILVL